MQSRLGLPIRAVMPRRHGRWNSEGMIRLTFVLTLLNAVTNRDTSHCCLGAVRVVCAADRGEFRPMGCSLG